MFSVVYRIAIFQDISQLSEEEVNPKIKIGQDNLCHVLAISPVRIWTKRRNRGSANLVNHKGQLLQHRD